MARHGSRAKQGSRLVCVGWALFAVVALGAPAQADGIFVVFENPAAGALAVKGAALDDEMAKLGALEVEFGRFRHRELFGHRSERRCDRAGPRRIPAAAHAAALGPGVPALLQTAGAGGHYGDVTVHFRTSGRQAVDYATLALKLVAPTSVEIAAATDGPPQARVALTFGSMKLDVFAQDAKGEVATSPETGQWNAMTGTADFATVPRR